MQVSYCASHLQVDHCKKKPNKNQHSTDLHSKQYEDSDGCSYGESDTSNWEYHPEHVDGEVGLMVDEFLST